MADEDTSRRRREIAGKHYKSINTYRRRTIYESFRESPGILVDTFRVEDT